MCSLIIHRGPGVFNKNHKTFQAIYNDKAYSVDEIWDIASLFKQFLNNNQLTILCADNDIFSLSIYLGALKFNSPIMLLNHDADIVDLKKHIRNVNDFPIPDSYKKLYLI